MDEMKDLISIEEAAERGFERLRLPIWTMPEDHLKIDIINGNPGPWTHLFSPYNLECNGKDPVDIICTEMDYKKKEWLPYNGALPESDEYKEKVNAFKNSGEDILGGA